MEEELLTVEEAAREAKVNPQTLRKWIRQGKLDAVRYGRSLRVKRSDLRKGTRDREVAHGSY